MIRVRKDSTAPHSLLTTSAYDGEDVKRQLLADQEGKCYICERSNTTDFEIEHLKSRTNYPELKQDWSNLLLSCGFCNRKKSQTFDDILNPIDENIEDEIAQRVDFKEKRAVFCPQIDTPSHNNTVNLLNIVFNGSHRVRTTKEERFFEYFISAINRFQETVACYLLDRNQENENAVRYELSINNEFLGFKYWIIRDNPSLFNTFSADIRWNK